MPAESDLFPIDEVLGGLRRTTGLSAGIRFTDRPQPDTQLVIDARDGEVYYWTVVNKPSIDRRDQLVTFKNKHGGAVLITRSLSSFMVAQCRELDIQFIDHAGNCFLHQPGFFAYVCGATVETKEKTPSTRGLTPAALRVMLAILTRPALLNSNVRTIAHVAMVSHGAAGSALTMLENMGFLSSSHTGRRVLAMPERWLDAWAEGYLGRLRPKLQKMRMSAPHPIASMLDRFNPQMREIIWGGEAAAAQRGLGLKPGALTLYVDFQDPQVVKEFVKEYRLRHDPDGQIELVGIFWNTIELASFPFAPDALIYADLIGTGDARTFEVADVLKRDICRDVERQA